MVAEIFIHMLHAFGAVSKLHSTMCSAGQKKDLWW